MPFTASFLSVILAFCGWLVLTLPLAVRTSRDDLQLPFHTAKLVRCAEEADCFAGSGPSCLPEILVPFPWDECHPIPSIGSHGSLLSEEFAVMSVRSECVDGKLTIVYGSAGVSTTPSCDVPLGAATETGDEIRSDPSIFDGLFTSVLPGNIACCLSGGCDPDAPFCHVDEEEDSVAECSVLPLPRRAAPPPPPPPPPTNPVPWPCVRPCGDDCCGDEEICADGLCYDHVVLRIEMDEPGSTATPDHQVITKFLSYTDEDLTESSVGLCRCNQGRIQCHNGGIKVPGVDFSLSAGKIKMYLEGAYQCCSPRECNPSAPYCAWEDGIRQDSDEIVHDAMCCPALLAVFCGGHSCCSPSDCVEYGGAEFCDGCYPGYTQMPHGRCCREGGRCDLGELEMRAEKDIPCCDWHERCFRGECFDKRAVGKMWECPEEDMLPGSLSPIAGSVLECNLTDGKQTEELVQAT